MKLDMQFKDYISALGSAENDSLSFDVVLRPFGLSYLYDPCKNLFVGHLIDYLSLHCQPSTVIDAIDVAQAMWELGVEGADEFLDRAPYLMIQQARAMVA